VDFGFRISDLRFNPQLTMEVVMDKEEMKLRTKQFALRVIRLVEALPRGKTADVLGRQLLRSGTSVGANYRAACRAKPTADFIAKMGLVEEETDESVYWMELLVEAGIVKTALLESLVKEGNEILAITIASIITARKHK
jgi:four helix bundle protein